MSMKLYRIEFGLKPQDMENISVERLDGRSMSKMEIAQAVVSLHRELGELISVAYSSRPASELHALGATKPN